MGSDDGGSTVGDYGIWMIDQTAKHKKDRTTFNPDKMSKVDNNKNNFWAFIWKRAVKYAIQIIPVIRKPNLHHSLLWISCKES